MNLKTRISLERQILRATAKLLKANGFFMILNDGEENCQKEPTDSVPIIMKSAMSTDMDHLKAYQLTDPANPTSTCFNGRYQRIGVIDFVYGNDGWDVIADYSVALEPQMQEIQKLGDKLCDRYN